MKKILIVVSIIVALVGTTFIAFPQTFTFTNAQIQVFFDQINDAVSTSAGSGDAGKMVELDASGKIAANMLTSVAGIATVQKSDVSVGDADIVTIDFDAPFGITESPDTEINVDIADDGIDSQHYAAGSIDEEHLNISNSPTDEYVLTYEADTSNYQWAALAGGGDITTVGACTTGDCTADFIDETDMADSDHGDFSYSGGVATLDADVVTGAKIADDEINSEHYAAASIDLEHLSVNSIDSDQYVDGSIDTVHIAVDAIDGTVIADNGINSEHYTDASIDRVHIVGDIIDGTKIEDNATNSEHYTDASVDPEHLNFVVAPGAGSDEYGVTYEHSTGNFELVSLSAGGTLNALFSATVQQGGSDIVSLDFDAPFTVAEAPDTYITVDVADDGIDSQHYAAASVDLEHMSVNSIDSDQYVDGSIDLAHMSANSIDSDQYVDASIDLAHMSVNSIDSDQYVDGSIDTAHIAADQINGGLIADDVLDSEHYVAGSIDEEHLNISNAAVDEYMLTYEADTSNFQWVAVSAGGTTKQVELSDSQVGDSDIVTLDFDAPFGVTEAPDTEINIDIADDGLDSQHYAAGSVDAEHLAADIVDETKIADDGLDSEHYNDASIDPAHINFVVAPGAGSDEYVVTYEHSTGNFELEVDAGGANLGIYDGGVQVGDTDIDKVDFDGTVFAITEPVDTDILVDIADDGLDSQHYIADSVDDEHINWADIANLSADGVLDSLGGNVAVGAHEFQSTGNIVLQLGDAAGSNVLEIEDSGGIEVFQINSDGIINPSEDPILTIQDSTTSAAGTGTIHGDAITASQDFTLTIAVDDSTGEKTSYIEVDGVNEQVEIKLPLIVENYIDAPNRVYAVSGNVDLDSTRPGACRLDIFVTAVAEIELWDDSECGTSGHGKLVHILSRTTSTVGVDPDTGDSILADSAGVALDAGDKLTTTTKGAYIELRGRNGGAVWDVRVISLAANWSDGGA